MTCDVTYDVLGNERHKAVCELRKLPDGYPSYSAFPFAKWYEDLSTALGICKGEVSCAKVRDTLIHLLGGDQVPVTLGDLYGISKEGDDGVDAGRRDPTGGCRSDAAADGHMADCAGNLLAEGVAPITDELRKWMDRTTIRFDDRRYLLGTDEELTAIADRIDAEHEAQLNDAFETRNSDENLESDGWVRLPVDADGLPIHVGDVMESKGSDSLFGENSFEVRSMRCDECGWEVYDRLGDRYAPSLLRHYHAPTVEDVLREFFSRYVTTKPKEEDDAILAEFATKLRLSNSEE